MTKFTLLVRVRTKFVRLILIKTHKTLFLLTLIIGIKTAPTYLLGQKH
ncbi:hypothetical protein THF5G08_80236 [Vibrio jasicida]|nr:hypothetical protein THF5G08_80236 [Vibrio jasicida]